MQTMSRPSAVCVIWEGNSPSDTKSVNVLSVSTPSFIRSTSVVPPAINVPVIIARPPRALPHSKPRLLPALSSQSGAVAIRDNHSIFDFQLGGRQPLTGAALYPKQMFKQLAFHNIRSLPNGGACWQARGVRLSETSPRGTAIAFAAKV